MSTPVQDGTTGISGGSGGGAAGTDQNNKRTSITILVLGDGKSSFYNSSLSLFLSLKFFVPPKYAEKKNVERKRETTFKYYYYCDSLLSLSFSIFFFLLHSYTHRGRRKVIVDINIRLEALFRSRAWNYDTRSVTA